MKPKITILSPEYPPRPGGVSDHTRRLAEALAALAEVAVLTSVGRAGQADEPPAALPFRVHRAVRDWQNPSDLSDSVGRVAPEGALLWQYVPHMYGRGGVNPALPDVIGQLRRQGRRQMILAHEIAAPFSAWPHRWFYAWSHRRQWGKIAAAADVIGISTEAWLDRFAPRGSGPGREARLTPSPANIPVQPAGPSEIAAWRGKLEIPSAAKVLAFFGSASAGKQFHWVTEAWRAVQKPDRPVTLAVIGDRPAAGVPREILPLFKPLGYLVDREVSLALQAADVLALPFVDGVSERRGSFMSGLAHGCAIATTHGENTGGTLRRADFFRASAATDAAAFTRLVAEFMDDELARRELGARGRAAYPRDYDWPRLVETIRDALWPQNAPLTRM